MKLFLEIIIQTFLAFFAILFITRILGRQQVAQLTFYEYINGITFGSIAADIATDVNENTFQYLTGLILFGILTGLVSYVSLKKRDFRKVVEGEPILVVQNGKILEDKLKRVRYSIDEINLLLRQNGCFTPNDVEYGLLEVSGELSIIKRPDKRAVTLEDLNLKGETESIPTELIIGGQILYENLNKRKLTGKDLMKKLKEKNIKRINEVMYATIDIDENLYVDKYDDEIRNSIDMSEDNDNV